MSKERCPYSINIQMWSHYGKKIFEFEEKPNNIITGFVKWEAFLHNYSRDPTKMCRVTAYIRNSKREKVYEIHNKETTFLTCMTPVLAYTNLKLGIKFRQSIPRFHSFNRRNTSSFGMRNPTILPNKNNHPDLPDSTESY